MGFVELKGDLDNLAPLKPAQLTCQRIAFKAGERLHDYAVFETPLRTGNLRTNWHTTPVKRISVGGEKAYHVSVVNETSYAAAVEYGTGIYGPKGAPYIIRAKPGKMLSWIDKKSGKRVYAKSVKHPGSPGHHMTSIAAANTKNTLQVWAGRIVADYYVPLQTASVG